jgi:methylenetetrahydrofolate reductase (NADPH)
MTKIIDLINEKAAAEQVFYSFEFFPPKTSEGVQNLFERQAYMKTLNPLFCDITWGAGGSTSELTLEIATHMQQKVR